MTEHSSIDNIDIEGIHNVDKSGRREACNVCRMLYVACASDNSLGLTHWTKRDTITRMKVESGVWHPSMLQEN